jgi:dTDP-4-amino-4,6-dideoxygalactose transaminase
MRRAAALQAAGIASALYYPKPLHRQPAYAACHDGAALPVAESLGERIMALPIHPDLTPAAEPCRAAIFSPKSARMRPATCRSRTAM